MSSTLSVAFRIQVAVRKINRSFRSMAWHMNHKALTDEERFALRLAVLHIREGRTDLAAEDLAWLEARL